MDCASFKVFFSFFPMVFVLLLESLASINALCVVNQLLDKIFSESANHWMSTKIHAKAKQDFASQQYKFRARAFKLESIIEIDISALENSFGSESFSEWKEFLSEKVQNLCIFIPCVMPTQYIFLTFFFPCLIKTQEEVLKEQENSEEELNHMEDSSVKDIVDTHNQLFGTRNLVIAVRSL